MISMNQTSPSRLASIREFDDPDPLSFPLTSHLPRIFRSPNQNRHHRATSGSPSLHPTSLEVRGGLHLSAGLIPFNRALETLPEPTTMAQTATRQPGSLDIWTGDAITPRPVRHRPKSSSAGTNGRSPAAKKVDTSSIFTEFPTSGSRRRRRITSATADLPTPNTSAFNISRLGESPNGGLNFSEFNPSDEEFSLNPDSHANNSTAHFEPNGRDTNGFGDTPQNEHSTIPFGDIDTFDLMESEDMSIVELSADALARYRRLSSLNPTATSDPEVTKRKPLRQTVLSNSRKRTPKRRSIAVPMPALHSDLENQFPSTSAHTPEKLNQPRMDKPGGPVAGRPLLETPLATIPEVDEFAGFGNDSRKALRRALDFGEALRDGGDSPLDSFSPSQQGDLFVPEPNALIEQLQARTRIVAETVAAADHEVAEFRLSIPSSLNSSLARHSELDEGETPTDSRMDVDEDDFFLHEPEVGVLAGKQELPSIQFYRESENTIAPEPPVEHQYRALSPVSEQIEYSAFEESPQQPEQQQLLQVPASIHDIPRRGATTPNHVRSIPRIGSPLKNIVTFSSSPVSQSTPSTMLDHRPGSQLFHQRPSSSNSHTANGSPIARKRNQAIAEIGAEESSQRMNPLSLPPLRPRKRVQTGLRSAVSLDDRPEEDLDEDMESPAGDENAAPSSALDEGSISEEWRRSVHLFDSLSANSRLAWDENVDGDGVQADSVRPMDLSSSPEPSPPRAEEQMERQRFSLNHGRAASRDSQYRPTRQPLQPDFGSQPSSSASGSSVLAKERTSGGNNLYPDDLSNHFPNSGLSPPGFESHTYSRLSGENGKTSESANPLGNKKQISAIPDKPSRSNDAPGRRESLQALMSRSGSDMFNSQKHDWEQISKDKPSSNSRHGSNIDEENKVGKGPKKSAMKSKMPSQARINHSPVSDEATTHNRQIANNHEVSNDTRPSGRSSRSQVAVAIPSVAVHDAAEDSGPHSADILVTNRHNSRKGRTDKSTSSNTTSTQVENEDEQHTKAPSRRVALYPTPSKPDAFARPFDFLLLDSPTPTEIDSTDPIPVHPAFSSLDRPISPHNHQSGVQLHHSLAPSLVPESEETKRPSSKPKVGRNENTSLQTQKGPPKPINPPSTSTSRTSNRVSNGQSTSSRSIQGKQSDSSIRNHSMGVSSGPSRPTRDTSHPNVDFNASIRSNNGSDVWMELERTALSRDSSSILSQKASLLPSGQRAPRHHEWVPPGVQDKTHLDHHSDDDNYTDDDESEHEVPFEHSYLTGDSDKEDTEDLTDPSVQLRIPRPSYTEAHRITKVPLKAPAASPDISLLSNGHDNRETHLDDQNSSRDDVVQDSNRASPPSTTLFGRVAGVIRSVLPWQTMSHKSPSVDFRDRDDSTCHSLLTHLPFLPAVEPWTKTHYIVFDILYQLFRTSPDLFSPDLPENEALLEQNPLLLTLTDIRLSRFGYIVTLRSKHLVLCALYSQLLILRDAAEYEDKTGRPIVYGNVRQGTAGVKVTTRDVVVRLMSMMITQRKRRDQDRGLVREFDQNFGAFSPVGDTAWYDLSRLGFWMNERLLGHL